MNECGMESKVCRDNGANEHCADGIIVMNGHLIEGLFGRRENLKWTKY